MIDNMDFKGIQDAIKEYRMIKDFLGKNRDFATFAECEDFFLHGENYFKSGSLSENIVDRLICTSSLIPELDKVFSKIDKLLKKRNNDEALLEAYYKASSMIGVSFVEDKARNIKVGIFNDKQFYKNEVDLIYRSLLFFLFASGIKGNYESIMKVLKERGGKEFLEKKASRFYEYLNTLLNGFNSGHIQTLKDLKENGLKDITKVFLDNLYYAKICLDAIVKIGMEFSDTRVVEELKKFSPLITDTFLSLANQCGFREIAFNFKTYSELQTIESNEHLRDREKILACEKTHDSLYAKLMAFEKKEKQEKQEKSNDLEIEPKENKKPSVPTNTGKLQIIKKIGKTDMILDEKSGMFKRAEDYLSEKSPTKKREFFSPSEDVQTKEFESSIEKIEQISLKKREFRAEHFETLVKNAEYLRYSMGLSNFTAKSHYFSLYFNGVHIDSSNKEVFLDCVCNSIVVNIMCGYYNPSDADRISYIPMSHDEKVDAIANSYKKNVRNLFEVVFSLGYHPRLAVNEKIKEMLSRGIHHKGNKWIFPPLASDKEEAYSKYSELSFRVNPLDIAEMSDRWVFADPIEGDIVVRKLYAPRYDLCLLK